VPGSISYPDASGDLSQQNFRALLFGDCTGNWQPGGAQVSAAGSPRRSEARIARLRRPAARRLRVPISVRSAKPFHSVSVDLGFDASDLRLRRVVAVGDARNASIASRTREDGTVTIALASGEPIPGGGPVIVVELERSVRARGAGPVRILSSRGDEG
jgi:hypothetical protein